MGLLIAGLFVWCFTHLVPGLMPGIKSIMVEKLGENGYKGAFSLAMLGAIVLIVFGWKSTEPVFLYHLGPIVHKFALLLMVVSVYLIVVAQMTGRVKRVIRHPQLTGVAVWAIAHLLMNGDLRSLVLFGAILLWCIVEIALINKRDGQWSKPDSPSIAMEFRNILVAAVILITIAHYHIYLAGVPINH
ncbi:MAG: NnrU family protein [Kangiellaceae bacterium]|nr:NnrU family protein [Kangiellaceae bacterium]